MPDYPLTARANGQWGKRVNGRWYYFGKWDDPQGAYVRYLRERQSLNG
jgi:hypothetical protein